MLPGDLLTTGTQEAKTPSGGLGFGVGPIGAGQAGEYGAGTLGQIYGEKLYPRGVIARHDVLEGDERSGLGARQIEASEEIVTVTGFGLAADDEFG